MLTLYKILIYLSYPYVYLLLRCRKKKGKEDKERFCERLGYTKRPRPDGDIIWIHGSSVGETLSILPLVDRILEEDESVHVMVTSGSVTSAALLEKRLPHRAFHQYIPVDLPTCTKRFVEYWKPRSVLWVESEFWPSILSNIHIRKIPLILINGRISDKSFRGWQKLPEFIKAILGMFSLALGQSQHDAERLTSLGATNVHCEGNIKFAAQPLPYDAEKLEQIKAQIGNRKLILVANTHHNEEERFIPIYKNLLKDISDLLMIVSQRHPHRGENIEKSMQDARLRTARRSTNEDITTQTQVYIADTIGEMGIFYRLSPIVFIGGSLINHGGQNFFEPMHFGDAVLVGPNMHNFRLPMKLAMEAQAVIQVNDEQELEEKLRLLLTDNNMLEAQSMNARTFIKNQNQVLDRIFARIKEFL